MNKPTATLSPDGKTITVTVPMKLRRRGGRKLIIAPDGASVPAAEREPSWASSAGKPDATLVKALARAFRWKRLLDAGKFATIAELAESEGISDRYVARVLRLNLLAPDIVEAILDGRLPKGLGLAEFMEPWPLVWDEQRRRWRTQGAMCNFSTATGCRDSSDSRRVVPKGVLTEFMDNWPGGMGD